MTGSKWPATSIALDDNGMPANYHAAEASCTKLLKEMVNELPDSFYRLNDDDARWIATNLCMRFLGELEQRRVTRGPHGSGSASR
jgi:hypothetical protein